MKLTQNLKMLKKCVHKIESMSVGVGPYLLNRVLTKKSIIRLQFFLKKKSCSQTSTLCFVNGVQYLCNSFFYIKVTSSENKTKLNILYPKKLYNMYISKT